MQLRPKRGRRSSSFGSSLDDYDDADNDEDSEYDSEDDDEGHEDSDYLEDDEDSTYMIAFIYYTVVIMFLGLS